jgi:hypothetical protein
MPATVAAEPHIKIIGASLPVSAIEEGCSLAVNGSRTDDAGNVGRGNEGKGTAPPIGFCILHQVESGGAGAFALVDTDGGFIDIDSLESLREAFERLFADPYLSAGQVLGLWESNQVARDELEKAYGDTALVEADRRRQIAERERGQHGLEQHLRSEQAINARRRSRRGRADPNVVVPNGGQHQTFDPLWCDNELLRHYRAHLAALRRRRAKAASFVEFREAHSWVEMRLREQLPDRLADIDALYAWAALHAR